MYEALLRHPKFFSVAEECLGSIAKIENLYSGCGMRPEYVEGGPETTELGKILATTAYYYNIVWAQQVQAICEELGVNEKEAKKCYELIESSDYTMKGKFAGAVGGHCCRENVWLLEEGGVSSDLLDYLSRSDEDFRIRHKIDPDWRR